MVARKQTIAAIAAASALCMTTSTHAFQSATTHSVTPIPAIAWSSEQRILTTRLAMQGANSIEQHHDIQSRRIEKLSAVAIAEEWDFVGDNINLNNRNDDSSTSAPSLDTDFFTSTILPVISASLMVTGNTVGAGMLVLPELAAGPGMAISSSIFIGAFFINLISGLLISDVAINQYSKSGSDVPSSFKEFAEVSLNSSSAATMISGVSIFVNALVMAFNTVKVGDLGSAMLPGSLPSEMISLTWALGSLALVGSLGLNALSGISSVMVTGLFVSFAGLLLPGLAHMTSDPMSVLMAPGTELGVLGSSLHLAPIILMSLVYQNIVPTITKMLGYDRTKTTAAISLGSFIPLLMYMAWSFAVVGGGIDMSAFGIGMDGLLMSAFSFATIGGSSLGCIMSLAEEFDTFLKNKPDGVKQDALQIQEQDAAATTEVAEVLDDKFSFPAVAASVGISLLASQFFAHDLNDALKVAGSFGSPLLYGILPVIMAQRQKGQQDSAISPKQIPDFGLGVLGLASTGMVGNELLQSFAPQGGDLVAALSTLSL